MPSKLPPQLRKLKGYQSQTEAGLIKALQRTQKHVRAEIARVAAKKDVATSSKTRDELYAEVEAAFKTLSDGIDAQLFELTGKVAAAAHGQAVADVADAGKDSILKYDPKRNKKYFDLVRSGNGKNLAAVFTDQMSADAIRQLRTAFVDVFRQGTVEGMTANDMQKAMQERWDKLAGDDNAFRFRDRSGRAWDNARYLQMLVSTNAQRVAVESYIDTLAESGFSLAQISEDGDPDCHVCAAWEGRIVQTAGKSKKFPTYEEAKAAGVFHPNCTHRLEYVDEELDADEINRQGKIGKPPANADAAAVQAQKNLIDEGRYVDEGLSVDDARRAVTADRTERAILNGTFSDDAAKAARLLTPAELDSLRADGIPSFALVKAGQTTGWRKGVGGGEVRVPRNAVAADVIAAMGYPERGKIDPPAPTPQPKKRPPAFPQDTGALAVVRDLGGSTGAQLVRDEHGQLFVRKAGGTAGGDAAEHIRSEFAVDQAYRALGIDVPECRLYDTASGPVKLSKYIEAEPLDAYLRGATKEQASATLGRIRDGFDVDVAFGNRDVVGASRDNILVDRDGRPWRIDNGAALGWRAQGARKADWGKWPDELGSMRTADINKGVFDSVSPVDVTIRSVSRDWKAAADLVPDRDRSVFRERVKELRELGVRAKSFRDSGYTDEYNGDVLEHAYALSKEGYREAVPKQVKFGNYGAFRSSGRVPTGGQAAVGADGMPAGWQQQVVAAAVSINKHVDLGDSPNQVTVAKALALLPQVEKLAASGAPGAKYWMSSLKEIKKAGAGGSKVGFVDVGKAISPVSAQASAAQTGGFSSLTHHAHDYITRIGGDPQLVARSQEEQAGHSWNKWSCLRKAVQELARPVSNETTWVTTDPVKRQYFADDKAKLSDKKFKKQAFSTFAAYDAAVQLALENTSFERCDAASRTVLVMRSEKKVALSQHGIGKTQKGKAISYPRGFCESHSVFSEVYVDGATELTLVRVPFAQIKGLYFFERRPGDGQDNGGCFLGEGENEFVCDARGADTVYVKSRSEKVSTPFTSFDTIISK